MDYSFVILTGMSGAGKSLAAKALEDVGFFCIDNMPTALILKLLELKDDFFMHNKKVACVVDIRNGKDFTRLLSAIGEMRKESHCKVIFLDAQDKVLLDRYKETRRIHPLMLQSNISLENAIKTERATLSDFYNNADYIIDTSILSTAQLKEKLLSFIVSDQKHTMGIDVVSFGFKYGIPSDIDVLFDVRCLKNPFYVPELKNLTGNDRSVREFVFSNEEAQELLAKMTSLIDFSLPLYIKEGKSHLTIGFGCTGGKHRSVSFANVVYNHIKELDYSVNVYHRDIKRGKR
ncbi:MAG: RNase adapter RapZ [Oscillospiraceae bacterium]|nr:RNase adapter RapZ [Oscillospiraceae bacterium]